MVRAFRNAAGKISELEYTLGEMAELLSVEPDDLELWQECIPPTSLDDAGKPVYRIKRKNDLELWLKRARILSTGLSERSVVNIEKAGHLDAYAALAEDCPEGIDAHVWRSYAIIVFMQSRHGIMIDAKELAERAALVELNSATGEKQLGVNLAKKHLRLLQAVKRDRFSVEEPPLLRAVKPGDRIPLHDGKSYVTEKAEWLHQGLPKAWQGRQ